MTEGEMVDQIRALYRLLHVIKTIHNVDRHPNSVTCELCEAIHEVDFAVTSPRIVRKRL